MMQTDRKLSICNSIKLHFLIKFYSFCLFIFGTLNLVVLSYTSQFLRVEIIFNMH